MAKPGIAQDERVNGHPTREELEEIRALVAQNAQLMQMRNVRRDTFNALQSELQYHLLEAILEHVCESAKDQEWQGAHNQVEPCEPQQHVNVQTGEPDHHLHA